MKQFFSANLSNMTFVFSFIILLNAMLGYLGEFNRFVLGLATMILILSFLSYAITYIDFRSQRIYHVVNFSLMFIAFFVFGNAMKLISLSLDSLLVNGIIFSILYFLTIRLRKQQLNQLANAINEQLSDRK